MLKKVSIVSVADSFMGLYMIILAAVDLYYRGDYIEHAHEWTGSTLCQILGVLNTFSSEASVMTLAVISGDRFYKIVFPLHGTKFGIKQVHICVLVLSTRVTYYCVVGNFNLPHIIICI